MRSLRDELEQVLLEFAPRLLVDRRERLVHQQHLGIDGERPRQADALAHAARELMRIGALEALEADARDIFLGHRLAFAHAPRLCSSRPKATLRMTVGPGHQREILEHESALGARAGHRLAVDLDLAADVAGMRPAMILSRVVLPQPEGPSSEVSWPSGKSSERSLSASTPPA